MKKAVFRVVDQASGPVTTNQVAKELGVEWHTAEKRLKQLIAEGRVQRTTISGYNLNTVTELTDNTTKGER